MCPIAGAYKRGCGKSCGALGWWCLDCLFPCPMEQGPPVIVTKLLAEVRGQQFLYGVEKVFSPLRTPGVVKNLKQMSNTVGRGSSKISPAQVKNRQVSFTAGREKADFLQVERRCWRILDTMQKKILFYRPFFGGVRARNLPQKSCNIMGFMVEQWS